jgi:hypothetical protein
MLLDMGIRTGFIWKAQGLVAGSFEHGNEHWDSGNSSEMFAS